MDSRDYTRSNYLGGDQLTDKQQQGFALEVKAVTVEEMRTGADKLCLHWVEKDYKPLLLNKTNTKRMQKMFGHNTEDWETETINLWFDPEVEYMGDIVGGIRIRITPEHGSKKK